MSTVYPGPIVSRQALVETTDLHRRLLDGDISLWVGSGISWDRLGGLDQFFIRFLQRLSRESIERGPESEEAKLLAEVLVRYDNGTCDATTPFEQWEDYSPLLEKMLAQYSTVVLLALDRLGVQAKSSIFDIPGFYGAAQDFDLEHDVITALLAERLVSEVVSTNWDALIEAAAATRLPQSEIAVVVAPNDTVDLGPGPMLLKLHGCARRALHPEAGKPPGIIVVSERDIQELKSAENAPVLEKVRAGIREHACVFVGLSGQDYDLQTLLFESRLAELSEDLTPRVFFVERGGLNDHQRKVLSYLYSPAVYVADTSRRLEEAASIDMLPKPALASLLILGLTEKCIALLQAIPSDFPEHALASQTEQWLNEAVSQWLASRNGTGEIDADSWRAIALEVTATVSTFSSLYRDQSPAFSSGTYSPITSDSPRHILDSGEAADSLMHRLVMITVLTQRAAQSAGLSVAVGSADGTDGHMKVETAAGPVRVFFVKRSHNRVFRLIESGVLDPLDPSVIVLYAQGHQLPKRKFNAELDLPLASEDRFQEVYLEQDFFPTTNDPAAALTWLTSLIAGGVSP